MFWHVLPYGTSFVVLDPPPRRPSPPFAYLLTTPKLPQITLVSQLWGEGLHIGRYDLLKGVDAKLQGQERLERAASLGTMEMLKRASPPEGFPSAGWTMMDMGSAYGTTARMAVKEFGCKVKAFYAVKVTALNAVILNRRHFSIDACSIVASPP